LHSDIHRLILTTVGEGERRMDSMIYDDLENLKKEVKELKLNFDEKEMGDIRKSILSLNERVDNIETNLKNADILLGKIIRDLRKDGKLKDLFSI